MTMIASMKRLIVRQITKVSIKECLVATYCVKSDCSHITFAVTQNDVSLIEEHEIKCIHIPISWRYDIEHCKISHQSVREL